MIAAELQRHTAYAELHQLIAELSLISHAPIQGYEFAPSEFKRPYAWRRSDSRPAPAHTTSHRPKGGDTKAPQGSDVERRPRAPRVARIDGNAQSEKAWDVYEDDLAAWKACYHRRTPDYFRRQLERCRTVARLEALRDEARETLKAWRQTPLPVGQEPEYGSAQWKRWIGESKESAESLANRTWNPRTGKPVGKRYINKIRQQYREAA